MKLCEKERRPPLQYIMADTPGQIEIFTWSASGQIITEAFASTFPTVILFVLDTPRCSQPQSFMSNMLQVDPLKLLFSSADVRLVQCHVLPRPKSHSTVLYSSGPLKVTRLLQAEISL